MGGTLKSISRSLKHTVDFLLNPVGQFDDYTDFIINGERELIRGRPIRKFEFSAGDPYEPLDTPFGPKARTRGVVAYIAPIKKEKISEDSGKGGGSSTTEDYIYRTDIAIDFAEALPGGVVEVSSVWADGQFVYGQNPDVDVTSDLLSCTKLVAGTKTFLIVASPANGPNLKKFKPGVTVEMSDWDTAGNNVTAEVVSSKKKDDFTSSMKLKIAAADAAGVADEAAGAGTPTIFQENVKSNINELAEFAIYLGTDVQTPDPTIETWEGAGNVEAARGRVRVVISQFALNRWGNRVPLSWTAVIKASETLELGEAIGLLCERGGLAAEQYDVTGLEGDVEGFTVRAGDAPADMIGALMVAYDVLVRETDGQLVFFHREDAPHVTITGDDLGAHVEGEEPQREIGLQRSPALQLPSEVLVTFVDTTKDLDQSDARQLRANATNQRTVTVNLPIAFTPEDARAIAKRLLWQPHATRHAGSLSLPPSRQDVVEGDVLDVTAHGEAWNLIADRVDTGANAIVAIEATADNTGVVTTAPIDAAADDSDSLQVPPSVALEVMDLPALTEAHVQLPGLYFGVSLYDTEQPWPGGVVYQSTDDGESFVPLQIQGVEATMGYVSDGTLNGATGLVWDRYSDIEVTVWNGELESISETDALHLHNLAAIRTDEGWEVIVFKSATLTGTNNLGHKAYALDTFLRGVRGTEDQCALHVAKGAFVLLNPAQFAQLFLADKGKTSIFKAIPQGAPPSDFSDEDEATIGLRTLKPFAPTLTYIAPGFVLPTSVDVDLTWRRRTRAIIDPLDADQQPLTEETNSFEVDVVLDDNVVRTTAIAGTGTDVETSWTYTDTMQLADGTDDALIYNIKIYQMSTAVGRGVPLVLTLGVLP